MLFFRSTLPPSKPLKTLKPLLIVIVESNESGLRYSLRSTQSTPSSVISLHNLISHVHSKCKDKNI